jgi:predicted esterase
MTIVLRSYFLFAILAASLSYPVFAQEDDLANVPSQDLRAGGNENMKYFLIGPQKDAKMPEKGLGLLIVLPGGDGSAEFNPFVKRIFKYAMPDGFVIAQPVAVKWNEKQKITWPTEKNKTPGQKFTTEEFVDAILKDVSAKYKLNADHIFTLSWSSGGPAAYAIALSNEKITGSFLAMTVFKPGELPPLNKAKGRAFYIYHSPQDKVCPMRMAEQAAKELEKNGAKTTLVKYEGGHGWHGMIFDEIRGGMDWLQENSRAVEKSRK